MKPLYGWCGIVPYQSSSSKVISRRTENKAGASIATSPVQPKEHLFIDKVQAIADADVGSSSLSDLRFFFYFVAWLLWIISF